MDGIDASALAPPQAILRFLVEVAALVCWAVSGWAIGSGAWSWVLAVALPLAAAAMWGAFRVPGDRSANGEARVAVPGIVRLLIELDVLLGAAVVTAIVWSPAIGIGLGAAVIVLTWPPCAASAGSSASTDPPRRPTPDRLTPARLRATDSSTSTTAEPRNGLSSRNELAPNPTPWPASEHGPGFCSAQAPLGGRDWGMAPSDGQRSLFAADGSPRTVVDGDMTYIAGWLAPDDADRLFDAVIETSAWRQEVIRMYGREVPVPRITAWHADPGLGYTYSGIEHQPLAWTDALLEIKVRAEHEAGQSFNSVLVNRYRDGRDGVAWHSDDEPELGPAPVIASVSLGATRRFHVRRRGHPVDVHDIDRHDIDLEHGSLLLMHAGAQAVWEHQIPKTSKPVGTRVNLTFREIITLT